MAGTKSKDPLKTPMMEQYLRIKQDYQDCILFFRMGDFYEMFLEDAEVAAAILDIVLTKRQNQLPMCGIPYHAGENYIARLLKAGKKIAICEQMGEPGQKLMQRKVVRVITPGTVVEENLLGSSASNYIGAVYFDDGQSRIPAGRRTEQAGHEKAPAAAVPRPYILLLEMSTGDFFWAGPADKNASLYADWLSGIVARFGPGELVVAGDQKPFLESLALPPGMVSEVSFQFADAGQGRRRILDLYSVQEISGLGVPEDSGFLCAAGILLGYVQSVAAGMDLGSFVKRPRLLSQAEHTVLDPQTLRHLELVFNQTEGSKERTLFKVLNRTATPAGRRYLEYRILHPLARPQAVTAALDNTERFYQDKRLSQVLGEVLSGVADLERILSRLAIKKASPKDFAAIVRSGRLILKLHSLLAENGALKSKQAFHEMDPEGLTRTLDKLEEKIDPEADLPAIIGTGPFLRPEFDKELSELYRLKNGSAQAVIEFQEQEKKATGATTLKVRYNKVIGYFIEVSKKEATLIPDSYLRKQTLVTAERFTSEQLQEFEVKILKADESIGAIEERYFTEIINEILGASNLLTSAARFAAEVDFHISLARAAAAGRWVRPEVHPDGPLIIKKGRHPVVEFYLQQESTGAGDAFIANDLSLGDTPGRVAIITSPNMAGKSTYIRQTALIQLMAQMGSFVPAESARLPVVDRIFTRIGASDNLSRGQSTFMVEMLESAQILSSCSSASLVLMDEVGRGTATYDGLSLAWSMLEYLSGRNKENKKPLTMFATHYHELTQLGGEPAFFNLTMDVLEKENEVIFLRTVSPGTAHKSYGIHVARMAGIPDSVVKRARKIMADLEEKHSPAAVNPQLDLFGAPAAGNGGVLEPDPKSNKIVQQITSLDIDNTTPVEALSLLHEWQKDLALED